MAHIWCASTSWLVVGASSLWKGNLFGIQTIWIFFVRRSFDFSFSFMHSLCRCSCAGGLMPCKKKKTSIYRQCLNICWKPVVVVPKCKCLHGKIGFYSSKEVANNIFPKRNIKARHEEGIQYKVLLTAEAQNIVAMTEKVTFIFHRHVCWGVDFHVVDAFRVNYFWFQALWSRF